MKILIIFDSMYGCTEKVAYAIKDGFSDLHQVDIMQISHADTATSPTLICSSLVRRRMAGARLRT